MLYAGNQITGSADKLSKVSLDYLYHSLIKPKAEIETKIRNLRIIKEIDNKRYNQLKRELPYLVCGVFNPPFRRTENFAYIEYFFVDIDHITGKGLCMAKVREEIQRDARIVLSFVSPSEDGLKILFHLKERCYDHGLYSLFYKLFVKEFSESYHLEQVIDAQTSDVCRACFMSMDEKAYFNPQAEGVDITAYIDVNNPNDLFDRKKEMDNSSLNAPSQSEHAPENNDPDQEAIARIKSILQLKNRAAQKAAAYVPEQLNDVIDEIKKYIEDTGIQVTEIINISYGKKIRMKMGLKLAEINLFYGKRGFSVVISPRCGTNEELNNLTAELIKNYLELH